MDAVVRKEVREKVKHLKEMIKEFKGLAEKLNVDAPIVILYEDRIQLVGDKTELETLLLYAQEIVLEYRDIENEVKYIF